MRAPTVIFAVFLFCAEGYGATESPRAETHGSRNPGLGPTTENALLEDFPVVQAAALHQQTLQEAPANVTVISRAEIKKFGYRTFGEALSSIRGFYTSYDRIYHYIGVSGVSLPGDFNTRFLVMINGHTMTEHVYDSNNFFGQDFGLDMDIVERIEIIRGSASALYGSNAMLATINIITRSPVDVPGFRVSTEAGSIGERKLLMSDSMYLGKGASLLIAGSVFNNSGQDIYIPQYDSPATNFGVARHADGEQGYHTFANLIWGGWNFIAAFASRRKQVPLNWADNTPFNNGGSRVRDTRNFVEAANSRNIGSDGKLRYRFYYDEYKYDDRFDYDLGYIQDARSVARNEYVGAQVTWSKPLTSRVEGIFGLQGEWELRNLQTVSAVSPQPLELMRVSVPDKTLALFTQQEWHLAPRWKVFTGLRLDRSQNYGTRLSPRVALVYQPSVSTVYKAVYGRPFRNPSAFEKYFNDGATLIANPNLRAEQAHTFELSAERKIGSSLTAIVNVYQYRMQNLLQERFEETGMAPQFQNLASAHSTGLELEIAAKLLRELEVLGTVAFQQAVNTDGRLALPNSPHTLAKLRLGLPIAAGHVFLASSAEYMTARGTNSGSRVDPVFLQNITLTSRRPLTSGLEIQAGVRNLWNRRFDDPVALAADTIRQNGRSVFLKVSWGGSR